MKTKKNISEGNVEAKEGNVRVFINLISTRVLLEIVFAFVFLIILGALMLWITN